MLDVYVNGACASCLVDTGAVATILSKGIWDNLCSDQKQLNPVNLGYNLVGPQGTPLSLLGVGSVELRLGPHAYPADVIVAEALTADLILGRDFLKKHKCTVELGERDHLRLETGLTLPLGPRRAVERKRHLVWQSLPRR